MTKTYPDESAFPNVDISPGLTVREYFAACAMQGILGSYSNDYAFADVKGMAKEAVENADALIAALNKEPK